MNDPVRRGEVADELADVAGVVFALCNALNLDLSEVVARKMEKNELKYPVEKCRGRYRVED
jgi:NTP pyrophosphatase (non-canonical NTP hydrolase)